MTEKKACVRIIFAWLKREVYNEKNYKEKIQLMQGVMQSIVDGDYKKWCNNIGVVEPLRETDDTDLECAFE